MKCENCVHSPVCSVRKDMLSLEKYAVTTLEITEVKCSEYKDNAPISNPFSPTTSPCYNPPQVYYGAIGTSNADGENKKKKFIPKKPVW